MAALGYSGIAMREDKVDIYFDDLLIVRHGLSEGRDGEANSLLNKSRVKITIDLRFGQGKAKVLSCDLSEDYVRINADYRT
jgi:glutamate N-acetyltransferase/amino-acid N-acetyltransferase